MISKVDWLSFSVLIGEGEGRGLMETTNLVAAEIFKMSSSLGAWLGFDGEVVPTTGRKPYSHAWKMADTGVVVYAHPALAHALVEISGQAVEHLRAADHLTATISAIRHRLTRLDVATDIPTQTRPTEFAAKRDTKRFKSFSEVVSTSGETFYVGSRTSDRYARVYRYNEPHPRAHLLRVEVVLKTEQARAAVPTLLGEGVGSLAAQLGNSFGWSHDDWQPDVETDETAAAWRPERRNGKTVFWMTSTVAPSLVKLHQEGTLDAREWFERYVLAEIDKKP